MDPLKLIRKIREANAFPWDPFFFLPAHHHVPSFIMFRFEELCYCTRLNTPTDPQTNPSLLHCYYFNARPCETFKASKLVASRYCPLWPVAYGD